MPPEKLGRYEIVREIGHGAMGVVYEATDPTIGRKIALKAIRFDGIGTTADEAARRFKNEARAAGGLNHPNIVTVYDAGEDNGNLYLAMEFIEGSTLDALLRTQRTLSPAQTTDIVRQVCAGLDFAHAKSIVHRDIKPANVMLAPHGIVKITDFGIARAGEAMTMTGQVIGTPNYMSPEQVLGKTLDGRSDLFSVGVMLYEMITGERPFEGQSITTIMYKIVHETPISPRKLDGSIHPGLSALIEKSLAKAPDERFQTGSELTQALQNYESANIITSNLGAPTANVPGLADTNPKIDTGTPAGRTQPATQPPPIDQAPASQKRNFVGGLLSDPKTRKRTIAIAIAAVIWFSSTFRRHGERKDNESNGSNPSSAAIPAAPPAPSPSSNGEDSADESDNQQSTVPAVVVKKEHATSNKDVALLRVDSTPPAAQVDVDGKPTGKQTPTELQLPRGQHSVSVRMSGFQTSSANFRVKGGEEIEYSPQLTVVMPNISVPGMPDLSKLQELKNMSRPEVWQQWARGKPGNQPELMLNSRPAGARILIDGKDSGQTTPAQIPSKPGTYHLRFELDGYEPTEKVVTVGTHKTGMAYVNLKPSGSE